MILSLASDMSVGPLKYVSGYVITPIQKGLNEVGNWISDKGVYLQSNVDYAAQCKELQEKVDQLTQCLATDGYELLSGPRTTGDGYYESCLLGFEDNMIELTV